jgi:hypothetical protein
MSIPNVESASDRARRLSLKRRPEVGSSQPVAVVAQPALIYPFPRAVQKPAAAREYMPSFVAASAPHAQATQPNIDRGIAGAVLRAYIASKREVQDSQVRTVRLASIDFVCQFRLALLPREVTDDILRYYAWEPPAPPQQPVEPWFLGRRMAPSQGPWPEQYNGRRQLQQPRQHQQEAEYAAFMRELSGEAAKKQVQPAGEGLVARLAGLARFQPGRPQQGLTYIS